jgi:hypothetical protein
MIYINRSGAAYILLPNGNWRKLYLLTALIRGYA